MLKFYFQIVVKIVLVVFCFSAFAEEIDLPCDMDSERRLEPAKEHSSPSLASLEEEPSCHVQGLFATVNAITGDLKLSGVDYQGVGPDPLVWQRTYYINSSSRDGALQTGWGSNHASHFNNKSPHHSHLVDPGGFLCFDTGDFQSRSVQKMPVDDSIFYNGVTNTGSGTLSATTNLKNHSVTFHFKKHAAYLTTGAGDFQEFIQKKGDDSYYYKISEKKASGNKFHYFYAEKAKNLTGVRRLNRKGVPTDEITIPFTELKEFKKSPVLMVSTKDGRWIRYSFSLDKSGNGNPGYLRLKKVERPDAPMEMFTYTKTSKFTRRICKRAFPEGRQAVIEYYNLNELKQLDKVKVISKDDDRLGKVRKLKAPIGPGNAFVTTHTFIYHHHQQNSFTEVYDAYNQRTDYCIDDKHRLSSIRKYLKNQEYCKETLYWGNSHSDAGNILCRVFSTKEKGNLFARSFVYDARGNVLKDLLWGNLTGYNPKHIIIGKNKVPKANGCECFSKEYRYTNDGKNLINFEFDGKKKIHRSFHEGTSLVKSIFTEAMGKICLREFFTYDDNGAITSAIKDDGISQEVNDLSAITLRYITTYVNTPNGLPLEVVEKCLDLSTQEELQIKREVNTYNRIGRLLKKDVFDADNLFRYSLKWEYDRYGNVILETDAIGQTTIMRYDTNSNLIYKQGPDTSCHWEYSYDLANRMTKQVLVTETDRLVNTFGYDLLGNQTRFVDEWGNETKYEFDSFGRMIREINPQVVDVNGTAYQSIVQKDYNALGFPVKITQADGIVIHTDFTIRGQPYRIFYPDGSCEKMRYRLDGKLASKIHRNGTVENYTYDNFENLIKTEIFSPEGTLLQSTSSTYNVFHLLSERDAAGEETRYFYDAYGRLAKKVRAQEVTTYLYDALQRLCAECLDLENGDKIITRQSFDLLNRVIVETKEDGFGTIQSKVSYKYDALGNKCETTTYGNESGNVSTTKYNALSQPTEIVDAEGNKTTFRYFFDRVNELGQKVSFLERTDPKGTVTETWLDSLERVSRVIQKNSQGETLHTKSLAYDSESRIVRQEDDTGDRKVITQLEYNNLGEMVAMIEAAGTPEEKITRYTYNLSGQKSSMQKPSGVTLYYTYDLLGRHSELRSSDDRIHESYTYDSLGNLLVAEDLITGKKTISVYENSRLIQETFANGLTVNYTYDRVGRPQSILFSDGSEVSYSYAGCQLKEIERRSPTQTYRHVYDAYNLAGQIVKASLIGQAGTLQKKYDRKERTIGIEASSFEQNIFYDPAGNVIQKTGFDARGTNDTSYDYSSDHQLLKEEGSVNHTYENDTLLTRKAKDGKSYTFNILSQILFDGQTTYTYDEDGNLIRQFGMQDRTFTYDPLGRLETVTEDNVRTVYTYDHLQRRLSKTTLLKNLDDWDEISQERYVYIGQREIGSVNETGSFISFRVLGKGNGGDNGAAVAIELHGKAYAPIHDTCGSVLCLLDAETGAPYETYRFSAFGEEAASYENPWRFASKRYDPETGWIFFGRRALDPQTGSWTTKDPYEGQIFANLYNFVNNNPLTHIDLFGLLPEDVERIELNTDKGPERESRCPVYRVIKRVKDFLETRTDRHSHAVYSEKDRSGLYKVGKGDDHPDAVYALTNGMNTSLECCLERAQALSEKLGRPVYVIYNASHGILLDALEYVAQAFGGHACNSGIVAAASINYLDEKMNYQGQIHINAHSQGGEVIHQAGKLLSKEVRDSVVVNTYGSARLIRDELFGKVTNFVSTRDWIPSVHTSRYIGAMFNDTNVKFLQCSDPFNFFDHDWAGETYQKEIRDNFQVFKNKYGAK